MSNLTDVLVFPDHDYLNTNLAIGATDGQRNTQVFRTISITAPSAGARKRIDGVEYVAMAEYEWIATEAARRESKLAALLKRITEVYEAEDIIGMAEVMQGVYAALGKGVTA